MSRAFWYILGLVLLISAIIVPIAGWYLDFDHTFLFGVSLGGFLGAGYMLQLGNWSKSRKERSE
jgi:hypothetical protein